MGWLIALFVFLAVQGLMMDLVFLALAACLALGSILDARRRRQERRGEVAQALDAAEAILKGDRNG